MIISFAQLRIDACTLKKKLSHVTDTPPPKHDAIHSASWPNGRLATPDQLADSLPNCCNKIFGKLISSCFLPSLFRFDVPNCGPPVLGNLFDDASARKNFWKNWIRIAFLLVIYSVQDGAKLHVDLFTQSPRLGGRVTIAATRTTNNPTAHRAMVRFALS